MELGGELKSDHLPRNFQAQLDLSEGDNEYSYNAKLASGNDFSLTVSASRLISLFPFRCESFTLKNKVVLLILR